MTFEEVLLAHLGGVDDAWDIRATVRRCFFYDFEGSPVRLWEGQGVLTTTTGIGDATEGVAANEWLGTFNSAGENAHSAPELSDDRDGTAPVYDFGLPHVDRDTFDALKADQGKVRGRSLTIYDVIIPVGEGLLPQTPIRFNTRLTMQGADFAESFQDNGAGEYVRVYSASVSCKSGEAGRSRVPGGTYTDAIQRDRARRLGVTSDSGCAFVAKNAQRTFKRVY